MMARNSQRGRLRMVVEEPKSNSVWHAFRLSPISLASKTIRCSSPLSSHEAASSHIGRVRLLAGHNLLCPPLVLATYQKKLEEV